MQICEVEEPQMIKYSPVNDVLVRALKSIMERDTYNSLSGTNTGAFYKIAFDALESLRKAGAL